jgi:hypothetical protein
VPHDDESTEWAVWICSSYNYSVHKYAYPTEEEARQAMNQWSFSNILTKNNVEVDATGVYLAPRMGRLREAIDKVRKLPVAPPSNSGSSSTGSGGGGGGNSSDSQGDSSQGSLELNDSDWAVWIYEYYCVKRYGFTNEQDARKALEEWYSVRILTYKEEEIGARCRYNTDSIMAIRREIGEKKKEKMMKMTVATKESSSSASTSSSSSSSLPKPTSQEESPSSFATNHSTNEVQPSQPLQSQLPKETQQPKKKKNIML